MRRADFLTSSLKSEYYTLNYIFEVSLKKINVYNPERPE